MLQKWGSVGAFPSERTRTADPGDTSLNRTHSCSEEGSGAGGAASVGSVLHTFPFLLYGFPPAALNDLEKVLNKAYKLLKCSFLPNT